MKNYWTDVQLYRGDFSKQWFFFNCTVKGIDENNVTVDNKCFRIIMPYVMFNINIVWYYKPISSVQFRLTNILTNIIYRININISSIAIIAVY